MDQGNNGLKYTKVNQKWVPVRDIVQAGPIEKNDEYTNLERQNLIIFVIEGTFINYDPIEMNYFNRFVAEENDQFEVYAFYRMNGWVKAVAQIKKAVQKYAEQSKRDKTDKNTVHFIWAGHMYDLDEILRTIKKK